MFPLCVVFSDEELCFVHGEVNKQNHGYWSHTNPDWRQHSKGMDGEKVIVWCGIWGTRMIRPLFIHGTLTGEKYRALLDDEMFPELLNESGNVLSFFQQDGALPHYALCAR